MLLWCAAFLFFWIACGFQVHGQPDSVSVGKIQYEILRAQPGAVRIVWKDETGNPLGTFPAAHAYLSRMRQPPWALINGGIFDPGGKPSGLLIQDGKELCPLNLRAGEGNFYLKPNGVFFLHEDGAQILDSEEYASGQYQPRFAVQSGPLLVCKGKLHPVFRPNSETRRHRNGVGIDKEGKVVFAMSRFDSTSFPTLYEFASLFKLRLDCDNALFLDGDLSSMKLGSDMQKPSNGFGSIIAILP